LSGVEGRREDRPQHGGRGRGQGRGRGPDLIFTIGEGADQFYLSEGRQTGRELSGFASPLIIDNSQAQVRSSRDGRENSPISRSNAFWANQSRE
jgi:hypothetical protein